MSFFLKHTYHLVDESPWPIISSIGSLFLTLGLLYWFYGYGMSLLILGIFLIFLVMYQWWKDVSMEGSYQGLHTGIVEMGLRWGMALFIVSEIMFFFSFFWAFFHSSLSPTLELGSCWPPAGINVFNPWEVPLLNTLILLMSGITVTASHHFLMEKNHSSSVDNLILTVLLGGYFSVLQGVEYYEASFSIADSIYGSTFFVATGFHGLHVLIGSLFLMVCLFRIKFGMLSSFHHFGFEAAAWYWHFVDVVWLFLFVVIYWWGGL